MKNSKVLVAGGTGFIGTNLSLRLARMGCQVRATCHTKSPQMWHDNIHYVDADLQQQCDCARVVEGMDYVFMCAAVTSGAAVMEKTPLAHVTPNVVMNAQMLDAAYNARVKKFLFISSSAAYPPTGNRPAKEHELLLGQPYSKYYAVGWMKRYAEILCETYAQKIADPMVVAVVRPSNAYGPFDDFDFRTSHMTAALIRRVVERHDPLEVWGTGKDVRDLIYIDDLVDGILLAMEKTESYCPVNIASGKGYTVGQVLRAILAVDKFDRVHITYNTSKPSTIPVRYVSTALAESWLGFHAQTSLHDGLYKTVEWYKQWMQSS